MARFIKLTEYKGLYQGGPLYFAVTAVQGFWGDTAQNTATPLGVVMVGNETFTVCEPPDEIARRIQEAKEA